MLLKQQVERLFSHLTDMDKTVSEQDISKIFTEAGQQRLSGEGTGNSRALAAVRNRIERNSMARTVTSLKTLLNTFTKEPYGFLPVDVEWLVARLFVDGILTLTLNHEQLNVPAGIRRSSSGCLPRWNFRSVCCAISASTLRISRSVWFGI